MSDNRRPQGKAKTASGKPKLILLGLLVIALAFSVTFYIMRGWSAEGPAKSEIEVTISEGSTLTSAAKLLQEEGAIRSAQAFLKRAKLFGDDIPIKAGEYAITPGMSESEILDLLQTGKTMLRLITIAEGTPSIIVYDKLMKQPLLTGSIIVPAEGSILPDSYSFDRDEERSAVLARMQKAMKDTLTKAWAERSAKTVVKSPQEAITLASIVEKETSKPSERATVAGVYSNRLRIGMRLQADPTIIYPLTKGKPLGRRIRKSEIAQVNDYNTYAMSGLPKGPIANPGREAIIAVLNPADTKALYFVADGKGGHIFAETLAEHDANVKKWYAIRRERGEM